METADLHCADGNVDIYLTISDKLVLHASTLALHSTWFKASLSERWRTSGNGEGAVSIIGDGGDAVPASGDKQLWIYELRFEHGSAEGLLMRKGATTDNELVLVNEPVDLARLDCVEAHCRMLRAMYHKYPSFSHENFYKARSAIVSLANTATVYGCEYVVKLPIDLHLLQCRSEVLDLCASHSTDMLELAMAFKSEWIFMEAAVNLIGQEHTTFEAARPKLLELRILELFDRKREVLVKKLREHELKLFSILPSDGSSMAYTAVDVFCDFLRKRLAAGQGSGLSANYGLVYLCITFYSPQSPVVLAAVMAHVKRACPHHATNVSDLMPYVTSVYGRAAEILRPVTTDLSHRLNQPTDFTPCVTCVGVSDEELPWARRSD